MTGRIRACALALCIVALATLAQAQSTTPQTNKAKGTSASKARAEADPLAEQRRATAISLLLSLADDARKYNDQTLRARVQARTADALWETDADRARALFRTAWEAAEVADKESEQRATEDTRRQQQSQGGRAVRFNAPDVRGEVLRLAALHDRALGEELLAKLDEAREREASNAGNTNAGNANSDAPNSSSSDADPFAAPVAVAKRLRLARQLIESGNMERALQFADPALTSVTRDALDFLSALRGKDARAADQRYAALLARTVNDPSAEANTVSILSSYIFTPALFTVFSADGGAYATQTGRLGPPPDIGPELRAAFFQTAGQVLMRPLPPPDQDRTYGKRQGKYLVIKRLLPLFDRYDAEHSAALHAQLSALSQDVEEDVRDGQQDVLRRGLESDAGDQEPEEKPEDRIAHAKDAEERDAIYADLAVNAAERGDKRANDYVDKISDTELRKQVRAYADFSALNHAINAKDAGEVARIARNGELTHLQRSWAFAEAARLLAKTDRSRALELLEEGAAAARRIGNTDADMARALVAIATQFVQVDRTRAWELINEAVKAGNNAPEFTGEDGRMTIFIHTKFMTSARSVSEDSLDLPGVFRALAREDIYRAIELAKNFNRDAPRANATIAIAREILEKN